MPLLTPVSALPRALCTCFILIAALLIFNFDAQAKGNEAVGRAFRTLLEQEGFSSKSKAADAQKDQILEFYATRNFKPIWVRDKGPKGKAKALAGELKSSVVHGLSPEFYHYSEIEPLMVSKDPMDLARLEMLLTGALVEFGGDLMNGRVGPDVAGSMNAVEPQHLDAATYIKEAEASGDLRKFMSGLLRSDRRYVRLITKLVELLRVRKTGIWPKLSADGGEILKGRNDPRMGKIRILLSLYGDLSPKLMNNNPTHDDDTFEAVKKYQGHHGLEVNGNIDMATLEQMAVPLDTRIYQIKLNLERRRWQVGSVAEDHLYINLINGSMRLIKGGKVTLRETLQNRDDLMEVPTFLGMITQLEITDKHSIKPVIKIFSKNSAGYNAQESIREIRVKDALSLAGAITGQKSVKAGKTFELQKPLPVFITYATAWANKNGKINFRADILGRDAILRKHLFPKSSL